MRVRRARPVAKRRFSEDSVNPRRSAHGGAGDQSPTDALRISHRSNRFSGEAFSRYRLALVEHSAKQIGGVQRRSRSEITEDSAAAVDIHDVGPPRKQIGRE